MSAGVSARGYEALANLLVVAKVTREEIVKAVRLMADVGFQEIVPDRVRGRAE